MHLLASRVSRSRRRSDRRRHLPVLRPDAVVELEEQLRLKETLARLGELTAGIAHEFRNGLATIHGYSRLFDPTRCPSTGLRGRHPAGDRGAGKGGDELPQLRASRKHRVDASISAIARRAADDCATSCRRRPLVDGDVRRRSRGRSAAAAGVRQSGAERGRGVRGRGERLRSASVVAGRPRVPRVSGRQRPRHSGTRGCASSSRSSRHARRAPVSGWPSSRRSW